MKEILRLGKHNNPALEATKPLKIFLEEESYNGRTVQGKPQLDWKHPAGLSCLIFLLIALRRANNIALSDH